MARTFADIAFTEGVRAAQIRYGSRRQNQGYELAGDPGNELSEHEIDFIQSRDSFYQATVSESGWPYVQHRGGLPGFLRVLDSRTVVYADFQGNRQYISAGNLSTDERISLILVDYPTQRRLKLWGRARLVDESENADLIAHLRMSNAHARVERAVVIHVEAIDWNCPQHITRRYTEAELREVPGLLANEECGAQTFGIGPLEMVISGIRQLARHVRAYELRHPEGVALPAIQAGSHLDIPVTTSEGVAGTQRCFISSNPARQDAYEIAACIEPDQNPAPGSIRDTFAIGTTLRCAFPSNDFALHADARPAILIAVGIGICPIKAMALALKLDGRSFRIHYAGWSTRDMPYLDRMQRTFGEQLLIYPADQKHLGLAAIMTAAPPDAVFYFSGPQRLLNDALQTGYRLGISTQRIRVAPLQ